MDQPLWQPSMERITRANMTAFARRWPKRTAEAAELSGAQTMVGRASRAVLAGAVAFRGRARKPPVARGAGRRRRDAWGEVVRQRRTQFRREPAAAARRPACDHRLDRRWPEAAVELPRAASRGGEARRGSARRGRRPGRSGGGSDAACRPDHHRGTGDERAGHLVWSSYSPTSACGRTRSLRPDRAKVLFAADGYFYNSKKIDVRPDSEIARTSYPRKSGPPCLTRGDADCSRPSRHLPRVHGAGSAGHPVRAAAVRSPALHHVSSGTTGVPK